MLKKLKKTNRGIILALVVLIAVVIYVRVDNANFKENEVKDIENTVTGTFTQLAEINELTSQLGEGKSVDEVRDEVSNALGKYITDNFAYSEYVENLNTYDGWAWYITIDTLKEESGYFVKEISEDFYINDCTVEVIVTKITKNGSKGASCIADITLSVEDKKSSGDIGSVFTVEGTTYLGSSQIKWDDAEIQLIKEDGEWKICGIQVNYIDMY